LALGDDDAAGVAPEEEQEEQEKEEVAEEPDPEEVEDVVEEKKDKKEDPVRRRNIRQPVGERRVPIQETRYHPRLILLYYRRQRKYAIGWNKVMSS
jgi:hypothetical protein